MQTESELAIQDMIGRLERRERFTFVRFGDGELFMMDGKPQKEYQPWSKEIQAELIQAFQVNDPSYLIGCAAGRNVWPSIENRLVEIAARHQNGQITIPSDAIHRLMKDDLEGFADFVKLLRGRLVSVVSNILICEDERIEACFKPTKTHYGPEVDAYSWLRDPLEMSELIDELSTNVEVILCALGPAANVLGKRLFWSGHPATFIDMGSVLDAIAGITRRTWVQRMPDIGERLLELL